MFKRSKGIKDQEENLLVGFFHAKGKGGKRNENGKKTKIIPKSGEKHEQRKKTRGGENRRRAKNSRRRHWKNTP